MTAQSKLPMVVHDALPAIHNQVGSIETVSLADIDPSPFRDAVAYPYVERKVKALMRSVEDTGFWINVTARRVGNRIQIAYGHKRIEAARRLGMTDVSVVISDLDDRAMLSLMGRENGEDYNADFHVMLETWEAAVKFLYGRTSPEVHSYQPIEVARLLGWTAERSDRGDDKMNNTADACNSAYQLLREGLIDRDAIREMSVKDAREILTRASANIKRIETAGKALGTSAAHIERAKEVIGKAVKATAAQSRSGTIPQRHLRGQVDVNAHRIARTSQIKNTPLFAVFGKLLADGIAKMLKSDVAADKLDEIVRQLQHITEEPDKVLVRRLIYELNELSNRSLSYQRKLNASPAAKAVRSEGAAS